MSTTDAGDGYEPVSQDARLRNVLFGAADQPRIRYAPGGSYELQLPGMGYDLLVHYKGLANPSSENNFFQPASAQQNYATFIISRSRLEGFQHSELASWTAIPAFGGLMSFGVPTPAAAIPATGRVTYRGRITGMVDVTYWHGLYGGYFFEGVTGDVTVDVDFATRTVLASLALSIDGNTAVTAIGTFSSSPMALAPGVNAFSGLLNTADTGFNQFDALFTGPNADEAIGRFALPVTIGGARHQVMGAWIARKP